MSCASCCSARQFACCEQTPSIGGHSTAPQLSKPQVSLSSCPTCSSPPINHCCSCGVVSQVTPLKTSEASYGGCLCQSSPAPEHHVCSPSPHSHNHHMHHHHPHHHHYHQPPVASPLLYSHHCRHHSLQATPTEPYHAHLGKLHPPQLDPSPLCQSMSHGGSGICLSKAHVAIEGSPPIYQSTSHASLEPSPLSRPHPRTQLHPSVSYGVRPHPALREKLFTPESARSSNSKPLPPSLEFSPGGSECSPPVSKGFHLGVATGSSPASSVTSSPRKHSSRSKTAKQGPQAPVVVTDNETEVSYGIEGDMSAPPTGGTTSKPEVKVLDIKSTPSAKAAGSRGSSATTKTRSPILLYRWSFKVLPKGMVILLGFKSQDCEELKWRSGPVSERLSSTLLMTRSGQLYHLMGTLSRDEIAKEHPDINQPLMKKFKRGFPSEWQDLLCNQKPLSVALVKESSFKQPAAPELASEQQQEKKPSTTGSSNHSDGEGAATKRRIKKELPDDPLVMLTPLLSDSDISTPGSSFVTSQNIKRSSRGRIIKPARSTVSPYLTNCNDLYTYDWHGNFQGVNSAVIDLTLCDDPLPTKKRIKKESLANINDSIANDNMSPPTTGAPSSRKAPPTTVPAKTRRGRPRKVKVCNEVPVQTSEISLSVLDAGRGGSEVRSNGQQRKFTDFSSSEFEVVSDGEHLRERKQSKKKTAPTSKSAVAGGIGCYSDSEARRRARQPGQGGGKKREKEEEKINRKKAVSEGSVRYSDSDTRQRFRQPSGGGVKKEKGEKRRERAATGGNGGHKFGKKGHTSSGGGKEKGGRGVSRVLLSSEEGESEGETSTKSQQRARNNVHSKNRKLYISESETGSDQSESEATNERGKPTRVAANPNMMDAFSPLLSPAKKKIRWRDGGSESKIVARIRLGEPRERKMTQNKLDNEKERSSSKMSTVRPPDPMDAFSPLLSPAKKKSTLWRGRGGVGERETHVSSAIADTLREPRDSKMTQSQLRNLRQVVHSVPALTTNFWEVVARQMDTGHTAHQCSSAYHEQSKRSRMKPPSQHRPPSNKDKGKQAATGSTSAPAKPKVTKVTGGAGTLKRKRQLRDALEEMDKDYYDDVFESTPFKKFKKSVTIPEQVDDNFEGEEDSSVEGEESNAPRFAHCYTPNTAQSRVGAPTSHTPNLCDYLTTPDLKSGLKRNVADHVIYKAQKAPRQGGVKKSVLFQKPLVAGNSSSNKGRSRPCVFEEKIRNIRTGELTTLRMFEDSDDDSSTSDDPFDDILMTLTP